MAILRKKSTNIIKEAEAEAEVIKKDMILQAKEKFLQLKSEHEKVINEKNHRILDAENKLKQREGSINQKIEDVHRNGGSITRQHCRLNAQNFGSSYGSWMSSASASITAWNAASSSSSVTKAW